MSKKTKGMGNKRNPVGLSKSDTLFKLVKSHCVIRALSEKIVRFVYLCFVALSPRNKEVFRRSLIIRTRVENNPETRTVMPGV